MINEFTVVFERDEDWYVAYCLELPGANSQGKTKAEARENVAEAIALLLEVRREDGRRGLPPEAEQEVIVVETPLTNEFTAVVEWGEEWYISYCLEVPANGQGKTKDAARENMAAAIPLVLELRREDGRRGLPPEAEQEVIMVEEPQEGGRLSRDGGTLREVIVVQ